MFRKEMWAEDDFLNNENKDIAAGNMIQKFFEK